MSSGGGVYRLSGVKGASPLTVDDAKGYMKVTTAVEDTVISDIIDGATTWGERYTGREFRVNTWVLTLDHFTDSIIINRDHVNTINNIKYYVDDVLITIPDTVYYLDIHQSYSELHLKSGQIWPTDGDDRDDAIKVNFDTKAYHDIEVVKLALYRHVSYLYANRGDSESGIEEAASKSGAKELYNLMKVIRI